MKKSLLYDWYLFFVICIAIFPNWIFAEEWRSFTTPHGLASNKINSMVADNHGNIWFGTWNGLSKFNGIWHTYRNESGEGLVENHVNTVYKENDGHIWVGTVKGVCWIDPNSDLKNPNNWLNITSSITDSNLANDDVRSIIEDKYGNMWFGTKRGGIFVFDRSPYLEVPWQELLDDSSRWRYFTTRNGLSSNTIHDFAEDINDNIWVATEFGINKYNIGDGTWERYKDSFEDLNYNDFSSIFKDLNGKIWIGSFGGGLFKIDPKSNLKDSVNWHKFTQANTFEGLVSDYLTFVTQDSSNYLWIGTNSSGVCKINLLLPDSALYDQSNWTYYNVTSGLAGLSINAILQDYENNMWFATSTNGVTQYDFTWRTYSIQNGIVGNRVYTIIQDSSRHLWFGSDQGISRVNPILDIFDPKNWQSWDSLNGLIANKVLSIITDKSSNLWIGTNGGITKVNPFGNLSDSLNWTSYNKSNGLADNVVNCILEDKDNYLWFGTNKGLNRVDPSLNLKDSSNWETFNVKDGLADSVITSILQDNNGNIWFGTYNGLSRIKAELYSDLHKPSSWEFFTNKEGLISNIVNTIFQDLDGNIWFGTDIGVSKADPSTNLRDSANWINYGFDDGLASNWVCEIKQNRQGDIWFGTAAGASKYTETYIKNNWTTYTEKDGLGANYVLAVYVENNSEIWFGTNGGGVSRYKPKAKPPDTFIINDYTYVTENIIEFNYMGWDLNTTYYDLRYSYRLDNGEWSVFSTALSAKIFFESSDKPTFHCFEVRSMDRDGNIDPIPAVDTFWKIGWQMGGWISTELDSGIIELFIPPYISRENQLSIKELELYKFKDNSIISAFEISNETKNNFILYNNPAIMRITLNKINNYEVYRQESLTIFLIDSKFDTLGIGGTVETKFDTLITITTAFTKFGTYFVKKQHNSYPNQVSKEIQIQPRIFSPKGGGKGHGNNATISFFLEDESDVTIKIYNLNGRLVKILREDISMFSGTNAIEWDGCDKDGSYCTTGPYIVTVEAGGKVMKKTVMVSNKYQ